MSLKELESFQVRALAHYTGMWRTWEKIKPAHREPSGYPEQAQWIMVPCNGTRAPMWACWNLQARGWTKVELADTRHRIFVRDHTLPQLQNWAAAIRFVQRIYPGTLDWLSYISDREGCIRKTLALCDWVWYGGRPWTGHHIGNDFLGADTVGGPLQFRFSTFNPHWPDVVADLRRRGFIVPHFAMPPAGGDPKYAAWLSPMGQALTGAYMRYTHQDGCHWCQ